MKKQYTPQKRMCFPHDFDTTTNPKDFHKAIENLRFLYGKYNTPFLYKKIQTKDGQALPCMPYSMTEENLDIVILQIYFEKDLKLLRKNALDKLEPWKKREFIEDLDKERIRSQMKNSDERNISIIQKGIQLLDTLEDITGQEYEFVTLLEVFPHCNVYPIGEVFGRASWVLQRQKREYLRDLIKKNTKVW